MNSAMAHQQRNSERECFATKRRPGAFGSFAGKVLRRINAKFADAGDFAGGVVKNVRRAFGKEPAALRVGVGVEREDDVAVNNAAV
ncbi:MAG: hypothetical protein EXS30_00470 [Pedosphaera sp.]|nr:hypothetical protein [Pedosphaera sp.]